MKTFEPGFFALENFIQQQETFDFLDLHTGEPKDCIRIFCVKLSKRY